MYAKDVDCEIFRKQKNLQNTAVLVGKSERNVENPQKNRVLFFKADVMVGVHKTA
jgi:hypothetical protein